MNRGMLRQHPFLMGIAALVVGAVLLVFTMGTEVSYAAGGGEIAPSGGKDEARGDGGGGWEIQPSGSNPSAGTADGEGVTGTGGGSVDLQGASLGTGVEIE